MTRRTIYCPGVGKDVPLGVYVRAVKLAKANPDRVFKCGLTTWDCCTGQEIVWQFRRGMMDRINQGIPYSQRGMPGESV